MGGERRETFTHIFNTTHHLPVFLYCGTEQNCPVYKYKNPKEWTSIGAIWKGLTSNIGAVINRIDQNIGAV